MLPNVTRREAAQAEPNRRVWLRVASWGFAVLVVVSASLIALGWRYRFAWPSAAPPLAILSQMAVETPKPPEAGAVPAPVMAEPLPHEAPAIAETAAASKVPVISDPRWIARPAHPERYYPREAFLRGIAGRVELDCVVEVDGRLDCVVASESPPNQGFAQAALAIARAHVMAPALVNGVPAPARHQMVVPFSTTN